MSGATELFCGSGYRRRRLSGRLMERAQGRDAEASQAHPGRTRRRRLDWVTRYMIALAK